QQANLDLVQKLSTLPIWLKIGLRSFIRDGKPFIEAIKAINPDFKIFLDLKLYDIPNTMADAAESIMELDIDMFNVHASAGKTAMQTVMQRLSHYPRRPLVLAVTALTSFDEAQFQAVYEKPILEKATQWAQDAYDSALDGVVCSVFESDAIKTQTHNSFLTLTPGIRPFGEEAGDQMRVATLDTARQNRVDFVVVGRPIYESSDPLSVVERILREI
ncbi:MAG: orotidine 5'-phosphate decarboxylase, partial [Sulfuricurvum sp. PC08-66]